MQIGLFLNAEKKGVFPVAQKIANWFSQKKLPLYCPAELYPCLGAPFIPLSYDEMFSQLEVVIVLGGDGTFLGAARIFVGHNIPLLGFNLGQLGFLMDNDVNRVDEILDRLITRDYTVAECMMLRGEVYRDKEMVHEILGFNDIVVTKGNFAQQVELKVFINNDHLATYPGDGLIISTPTGSTAYSLSAGGPIVNPKVKAMIITPICPHTFYSRSLIVSADEEIIIENARSRQKAIVTGDGKEGFLLGKDDLISIKKSELNTLIVRFREWSYYQLLANRLKNREI